MEFQQIVPHGLVVSNGNSQAPVENKVPARVKFALDALAFFAHKTQQRVAIGNVANDILEGQKLVNEEKAAQAAAATVLHDYFKGTMEHDEFEKIRAQSLRAEGLDTTVILCPACRGEKQISEQHSQGVLIKACPLCHKRGSVRVLNEGEDDSHADS